MEKKKRKGKNVIEKIILIDTKKIVSFDKITIAFGIINMCDRDKKKMKENPIKRKKKKGRTNVNDPGKI